MVRHPERWPDEKREAGVRQVWGVLTQPDVTSYDLDEAVEDMQFVLRLLDQERERALAAEAQVGRLTEQMGGR